MVLLIFNSLKFSSNGYSYAIFTILFYESQVAQLGKSITKEKKGKKSANDFFIAVFLHFYDLKYQNLTKKTVV